MNNDIMYVSNQIGDLIKTNNQNSEVEFGILDAILKIEKERIKLDNIRTMCEVKAVSTNPEFIEIADKTIQEYERWVIAQTKKEEVMKSFR